MVTGGGVGGDDVEGMAMQDQLYWEAIVRLGIDDHEIDSSTREEAYHLYQSQAYHITGS